MAIFLLPWDICCLAEELELVADWDRMCTMEENVMVTKEGAKPNRRVSDRIKRLSANFVNSGQGEGAELVVSGREVVDQTNVHTFKNFLDILTKSNFNQNSKVFRPRQQKLCVVRRGAFSLVKLSTNEKRAREFECVMNLPGTKQEMKMKVSPIYQG